MPEGSHQQLVSIQDHRRAQISDVSMPSEYEALIAPAGYDMKCVDMFFIPLKKQGCLSSVAVMLFELEIPMPVAAVPYL